MEWASDRIEFLNRDTEWFTFCPGARLEIRTIRLWRDQKVGIISEVYDRYQNQG